jgi:hypothetical protein
MMTTTANAGPPGPKVIDIFFEVTHERDGKKYPNQVKEAYHLTSDGKLHYGAYFGGMPIDWNHNDSVEWPAGDAGKRVLAVVNELLADPKSGMRKISDDESAPPGSYSITVTFHDADSSRVVDDKKSRAWAIVSARFAELIAAFEKATGRPKKPEDLRQQ